MLGVLLAFCSALVNGTRTDLISTLIEQTQASLQYQAVGTKYRMMESEIQQLHALLPDAAAYRKAEQDSARLVSGIHTPEVKDLIDLLKVQEAQILNTVTPTRTDLLRFSALARTLDHQAEAAEKWSESYEDATHTQTVAVQRYEYAQLAAEIGIVVCSVALLLLSRFTWYISVALAIFSMSIAAGTFAFEQHALRAAEHEITTAHAAYVRLDSAQADRKSDEKLLEDIEHAESSGSSHE
jgi:hypothetical protein